MVNVCLTNSDSLEKWRDTESNIMDGCGVCKKSSSLTIFSIENIGTKEYISTVFETHEEIGTFFRENVCLSSNVFKQREGSCHKISASQLEYLGYVL